MAEESIDFGNFTKKIVVNPAVPLQVLDIYYRNAHRVQATLLGKVYSHAIEILEVVPYALCDATVRLPSPRSRSSTSQSTAAPLRMCAWSTPTCRSSAWP